MSLEWWQTPSYFPAKVPGNPMDNKNPRVSNADRKVVQWMPPRPAELKETWGEWWEGWKLWCQQVGMNVWYGRGGLNVKVGEFQCS